MTLRIFLVEDSDDARLMLGQLLETMGCEVRSAGSMMAALRDFPAFRGEVLLSDLGLPDGDGWTLLCALREAGFTPYAIAMSGYGTLGDITASLRAGYRHHLVKPIELDALERLLVEARQEIESAH